MESIGKRMERLRKAKKLSIKELAEQVNVPATTYRDWEYGREIKGEPYLKLAAALGVSLNELLGAPPQASHEDVLNRVRDLHEQFTLLEKEILSLF